MEAAAERAAAQSAAIIEEAMAQAEETRRRAEQDTQSQVQPLRRGQGALRPGHALLQCRKERVLHRSRASASTPQTSCTEQRGLEGRSLACTTHASSFSQHTEGVSVSLP